MATSHERRSRCASLALLTLLLTSLLASSLRAQVAGSGTIRGTIMDSTGAVIPGATVVATQTETGTRYTRQSTDAGVYMVSPVEPGHYSLTVTAKGFQTFSQTGVVVDASSEVGVNCSLQTGAATETVTVTSVPLDLQTENATLGGTIDQRTVESLPMIMSDDQRMATSLAMFVPGVQENVNSGTPSYTGTASTTNSGIINGSGPGGDVSEIYIDGLPESGGDGDPRYVWTAISMDAVSQMRFETAGYPATEQGMGTENFEIKSGTSQWHGSGFEYVRNTILDTWGFFQPGVTEKNSQGQVVQMGKPAEHQNEFGATIGGPLYKSKVFFFGDYDAYRESKQVAPLYEQIPNIAETQGDFSEMLEPGGLGYQLYDPYTTTCTTPGNPATCSRNAIPNNQLANMQGGMARISSISQAMENAGMMDLAKQANQSVPIGSNNFLATSVGGLNNWSMTGKIDVNLSDRHKIAGVYAQGRQASVGIGSSGTNQAPPPYTNAHGYAPKTKIALLEDVYTVTPYIVNELKYGVGRYYAPEINFSNNSPFSASRIGIGGLPSGQIETSFPTVSFGGSSGTFPNEWGNQTAYVTVATDTSLTDNLQIVHGRQSITAGVQWQWLQNNESNPQTGTSQLTLNYNSRETGALTANNVPGTTGFSYASFLLGAVDSASFTQQQYATTGLRLHPFSLYLQDDIKVTPRLTLNAGLRWDLYPPFHGSQNLFSFLNPEGINPYSGYPGALQFAGSGPSPLFCNCKSPAETYFGNVGPRLGAAYSLNSRTVLHAGFGIMYAHSEGTGITTNFEQGTGILGYAATPSFTNTDTADYPGLPAFWLNPNGPTDTTTSGGTQNGGSIPSYTFPLTLNAGLGTYYSTNLPAGQITSSMNYLDPRLGGRSPEFVNYTVGFQRSLFQGITVDVNYVANHGHFLAVSGNRGHWNNQANPAYLVQLGPIASSANPKSSILSSTVATSSDLAKAQALFPGLGVDPTFPATQAISQLIKPFPQYSGLSDAFDSDGNTSYNALQIGLSDRTPIRGLTFRMSWTWEQEKDDVGTYRSGYEARNVEWSLGTSDIPSQITGYFVYDIPAGRGHLIGGGNRVLASVTGGWRISGVVTYASGSPLAVTTGSCSTSGTCMPNLTPGYSGSPRKNGGYGSKGITWQNASTHPYIDPRAFTTPTSYTYGNAPRTAPYNLYGPGNHDFDLSLRRSFTIYRESSLVLQADLYNAFNNVIFGGLNTTLTAGTATQGSSPIVTYAPSTTASFGTVNKQANQSRDAQLAIHFNF